ncbi:hypothetical protein D3C84_914450 [compost metagenome]|jgi:hypothetical protein
MFANKKRPLHIGRWTALLLVVAIAIWYYSPPKVYIFYSKDGTKNISYALNTQHTIVRGDLLPSGTTGDVGHIFPNNKFFMELHWWREGERRHCVNITPRWPTTEIHLDRNGNIDTSKHSGTDADRLKQCITDNSLP